MLKKVTKYLRNFYIAAGVFFLLWMLFLDNNSFPATYKLSSKLHSMENEKEYYQKKIEEVQKDREQLFGTSESLEKFAREKYLMKKETEDVFIIVEEE